MAKLKISRSELGRLSSFLVGETDKIITTAINRMDTVLFQEAERLANRVRNSPEFQKLKRPVLIGRFGFTPEELARLDDLFPIIAGGDRQITNVEKSVTGRSKRAILNWVDLEKLKAHPIAEHPLTTFNPQTRAFEVSQVVSWIQWWEEGVTIRGHIFTRGNVVNSPFSRSGFGIMQRRDGSLFAISPSRIFERIKDQPRGLRRRVERAFSSLIKGTV
jgi:hypothetical protein